jgi:precorrin-6B methylase 2
MISTLEMVTRPDISESNDSHAAVDYVSRWREIVEARQRQIEQRRGLKGGDFWANRAQSFHRSVTCPHFDMYGRPVRDPFLAHVAEKVYPRMTVLDVGAGTGRFAIPLARQADRLMAVEPAAAMRQLLSDNCAAAQLTNVRIVATAWPEALAEVGSGQADITICSHVLYPIGDIVPFVAALEQATRVGGLIFIYLRAGQTTDFAPELWQELHDERLAPQPDYLDAYNVLAQMGICANLTMVKNSSLWRFDSLDEAVAAYRDRLCIHDDETAKLKRLRQRLQELAIEENGRLAISKREPAQAAIIWWQCC